jgi:hypothetical protein
LQDERRKAYKSDTNNISMKPQGLIEKHGDDGPDSFKGLGDEGPD